MADRTRPIAIVLIGFALGCGAISTTLDYWFYYHGRGRIKYYGLWEWCSQTENNPKICQLWKWKEDSNEDVHIQWIHGCQAMMITAVILNALGLAVALYATYKPEIVNCAQVVAILAGLCYIIAVLVFSAKYTDIATVPKDGGHLDAGFGLAVVAGGFNLVSCCVLGYGYSEAGYQSI